MITDRFQDFDPPFETIVQCNECGEWENECDMELDGYEDDDPIFICLRCYGAQERGEV